VPESGLKDAAPDAIAARHFYRSACYQQSKSMAEDHGMDAYWALPLPGAFCVRGDSFLASPNTSRSRLLASDTIDLLSSRRSNLVRMQMGLGLPVRDVLSDNGCMQLQTALMAKIFRQSNDTTSRTKGNWRRGKNVQLTYGELCNIGALSDEDVSINKNHKNAPRWLFRNAIADYGRISRVFQKWIAHLIQWTVTYRAERPANREGGFKAYDLLSTGDVGELRNERFFQFAKLCDLLAEQLNAAVPWDNNEEVNLREKISR
jgi:hypothetical protein